MVMEIAVASTYSLFTALPLVCSNSLYKTSTASERGFEAPCRNCRNFPAIDGSDYCGEFRGNADVARPQTEHWQAVAVPPSFAPTCQECCRPILENMVIYYDSFADSDGPLRSLVASLVLGPACRRY
jgi:hypothetical protein